MSLELNPVGVRCNLSCPYCYELPLREAGNYAQGYDIAAMKSAIAREGSDWTLFGGEPLLLPFADLADLLRWGKATRGRTGLQTNGSLITPDHVALFSECSTHVGISVDGPGAMNDSRWAGTLDKTREATRHSMQAIDMLCAAGNAPSLIVTLYKGNASVESLPQLLAWFDELRAKGVRSIRIHVLEIDHPDVAIRLALSEAEYDAALFALRRWEKAQREVRFDLFADMRKLLIGTGDVSCVWNGCDPLTTPAVRGVNGAGQLSNCSRTNKDGVDWLKADQHGYERVLVLSQTPQEHGGCMGCRFFFACKGQCPGTAIDGDWRNRTADCAVWYRAFEHVEAELLAEGQSPISAEQARLQAATVQLLDRSLRNEQGQNRPHGDHWDAPDGYAHADGPITVHGDQGMTQMHGDHSDAA